MNAFVLILTMIAAGADPQPQRVGILISLEACRDAGMGMKLVIEAARPAAQILWACVPVDGGV